MEREAYAVLRFDPEIRANVKSIYTWQAHALSRNGCHKGPRLAQPASSGNLYHEHGGGTVHASFSML
jgi:hypothetical protein